MFRIDRSTVDKSSSPYIVAVSMPQSIAPDLEEEAQGPVSPALSAHDDRIHRAARAETDKILFEARTVAEKMKTAAAKEAEAIKTRTYNEALKRGEEEAARLSKAREKADREEVARVLMQLNESLQTSLDDTVNAWEEELLDLSVEIARKIIDVELDRNETAFRSLVQNALSHMRGDAKVTVHVSPREYEKYFPDGDAIFLVGGEKTKTPVAGDPLLERGGCVVESEGEMINAGVEQQLKAMRSAMEKDEVL